MIAAPHNFAPPIEDQKLAKIGALALRWALIEYTLGNCLKGALRLDSPEATVMCFSLGVHERITRLSELNLSKKAKAILADFRPIMQGVQWVRNNALHSAVTVDDLGIPTFYRRSIQSHTSLDEILRCGRVDQLRGALSHCASLRHRHQGRGSRLRIAR